MLDVGLCGRVVFSPRPSGLNWLSLLSSALRTVAASVLGESLVLIFGHSAIKSRSLPLMGYCGVEGKDLFLSIVIDLTSMMNNKNEESSMRRFNASNNW